jgi:hypothetical protein
MRTGAILLGDKMRAFTYYKEARQQLAYVFDSSDYSVAEALFGTLAAVSVCMREGVKPVKANSLPPLSLNVQALRTSHSAKDL